MVAEFKLARVVTPTTTYSDVKLVWRNGQLAIWSADINAWTATRLALLSDTTFTKRKVANTPHVITLQSGEQWEVWPLYSGGCGCAPHPLKHVSTAQLLDPDYTFTGTAP